MSAKPDAWLDGYEAQNEQRHDAAAPLLRAVHMADLPTADLPPTRYAVGRILPRGVVTLLGAHGDAGKSYLGLLLAAHVACGRRFAELACPVGRACVITLEDSGALAKLRMRRVAEAYELDVATIAERVTVFEASGFDAALAVETAAGGVRHLALTAAFDQVCEVAAGHDLTIIDNASDAFDASEGERRMVRRFIRALQLRIAMPYDAAVLLLAHVDKAGARYGTSGETYSGSTAWHNSCRSRLALIEGDSGLELRQEKSNLGPPLEHAIALERAEHGVLVPVSKAERQQKERADEHAVLAALRGAVNANVSVSTASSGPRTAVHLLSSRPELPPDLAASTKRIRDALKTLEREGAISRVSYLDSHRHQKERYECGSSILG